MKCPNCQSVFTVKNGYAPSLKKRWKCNTCGRTFDKDTGKKYPPTTVPFQFISFVLYMCKKTSLEKTKTYVNFWLKIFELQHVPICSKKNVSKSAVYQWKNKYGKTYTKLVSKEEAVKYFTKLTKEVTRSIPECVPPENQKYEIREVVTTCTYEEALDKFQEMAEYLGENSLDYMKKYPEIVEPLIDIFKKEKTEQIFPVWVKKNKNSRPS